MYRLFLEIIFRLAPSIVIAVLNLKILISYRQICKKRRNLFGRTRASTGRIDAEERRLILLLSTTSFIYVTCIMPMAFLSLSFNDLKLDSKGFQVFRSSTNALEALAFSTTFYTSVLFIKDFRNAFLELIGLKEPAENKDKTRGFTYYGEDVEVVRNRFSRTKPPNLNRKNARLSDPNISKIPPMARKLSQRYSLPNIPSPATASKANHRPLKAGSSKPFKTVDKPLEINNKPVKAGSKLSKTNNKPLERKNKPTKANDKSKNLEIKRANSASLTSRRQKNEKQLKNSKQKLSSTVVSPNRTSKVKQLPLTKRKLPPIKEMSIKIQ